MSILPKIESWSNILKNAVIIGGICIAVFFLSVSIYANVTENNPPDTGLPKPPSIEKAEYKVTIRNTGNVLYTDSYEHPSNNVYILDNYWEIKDGKYRLRKHPVTLDELYFGAIIVEKR